MPTPRSACLIGLASLALVATCSSIAVAQRRPSVPTGNASAPPPAVAQHIPAGYQATRTLVARSAKLNKVGWLEAVTTYRPGLGFSYLIVAEGGDRGIRNRVLRKVLDTEVEMSAPGRASHIAISDANYDITRDATGRVLYLAPRRRETTLIVGTAHIDALGRLQSLEGRAAKSPSFWVRSITIRRTYQAVRGHSLPVRVDSVADVKLAGACEFSMWIDYTAVDGRRIDRVATRPRPSSGHSALLVALQQHPLR